MTKQEVIDIGRTLIRGGMAPDQALAKAVTLYNSNGNMPLDPESIEEMKAQLKVKSGREVHLTDHIREWVSVTNGVFSISDAYRDISSVTTVTNRNLYRVTLNRLCKEGVIQRVGGKDGQFRKVQKNIELINWLDATDDHLEIEYPLRVHDLCLTLPKNIVVIAGEKDAGKTAFLLATAVKNRDRMKVFYFSSEMGETELKRRMVAVSDKMKVSMKELATKITWVNQNSCFEDVIQADALNVVDFLEVTKDFWEIGDMMKNLYHKLNTGIIVVGVQKPFGRDLPLGGDRGLEKSRIAIAIGKHKGGGNLAKIIVGKNWATETNPKGLVCRYKLVAGCDFLQTTPWDEDREPF